MLTKAVRAALIGVVAAGFFGGCGTKDARPGIRLLTGPDSGGGFKEIIRQFEAARPDLRVELVEGPAATNTREDMYAASFMAQDGAYDVVFMDVIWVPKFAAAGWILPLDDRFPAEERADFLPGDISGSIYQTKIYRVPMQSDAGMLYYRKDLLDAEKRVPPRTVEELAELARALQSPPDRWGLVFQGQQYEGLVCAFLEVLWGFGGDVIDAEGRVTLDSPESVRALEWLAGLPTRLAPPGVTTYQEEECRQMFQDGRAVFMRNWPYAWTLCQKEGSPVRGKIGIVPMVHAAGKTSAATLGGWGYGISAYSKHPGAAWSFIEFATQAAQQKVFHFRTGAIPTRKSLFDDADILKGSPHFKELYTVLLAARPRPVHPRYSRISDILQRHVSAALVGQLTPEKAIQDAAEKIRQALQ